MDKYHWKFLMGTKSEPVWEVRSHAGFWGGNKPRLVAYAKRAKDAGWFVRISGLNDDISSTDKIYIGDDVFPPDFMKTMLEMHKQPN